VTLPSSADPAGDAGWARRRPRVGFFTDTSLCIGCKACEVACKEWNQVPHDGFVFSATSYDNTGALGADTWRHVTFTEKLVPAPAGDQVRWLMSSDVCKHCTDAACLDVCPTGALFRTEHATVVVQDDVCNGCGYCVPACPFGVIDQRRGDGRVWKCTLCYDRIGAGMTPACAQACPTESIRFGPLDELRTAADARVTDLRSSGTPDARLYGADPTDGVGGMGAFFLLLDDPETYGLPPDPVVTTRDLASMWRTAGVAALAVVATVAGAVLAGTPLRRPLRPGRR